MVYLSSPLTKKTNDNKWINLLEVIIVIFLVVGHNILRWIPNEIPFIFIFGWVSLRLRKLSWKDVGLKKPTSWSYLILTAFGVALFIQLLSTLVTEPLIVRLTNGEPSDFSSFDDLAGNEKKLLLYLLLSWSFAAFGEELSFRGYFLNRTVDLGGRKKIAWVLAIGLQCILFGTAHYYQGLTGMIDTGITALILSVTYLASGKNLWLVIFAHGFTDTIFFLLGYLDLIKYLH